MRKKTLHTSQHHQQLIVERLMDPFDVPFCPRKMRKLAGIFLLLVVCDAKCFESLIRAPAISRETFVSNHRQNLYVFLPRGGDAFPNRTNEKVSNAKRLKGVPKDNILNVLAFLNKSSKWILAAANLVGVILFKEEGAYIVIGCIGATFFTELALKPIINQGRPANSPLSDPGMPSSHSLSSFFVAIAWANLLGQKYVLLGIATFVASLRMICGYHTFAQISVGAVLGLGFGQGWMTLMNQLQSVTSMSSYEVKRWIWCTYVSGSVLFIWKIMSKWIDLHVSNQKKT